MNDVPSEEVSSGAGPGRAAGGRGAVWWAVIVVTGCIIAATGSHFHMLHRGHGGLTAVESAAWKRLGVDWKQFHPKARAILDDPFYWDPADDFSPHGNDTGADLLEGYGTWWKRNPDDDPVRFLAVLGQDWGMSLDMSAPYDAEIANQAAVALAFAEIKLRGTCRQGAAELALRAIDRQRKHALAAADWPHRDERLRSLSKLEAKLHLHQP